MEVDYKHMYKFCMNIFSYVNSYKHVDTEFMSVKFNILGTCINRYYTEKYITKLHNILFIVTLSVMMLVKGFQRK
jgi:hypothetical protein